MSGNRPSRRRGQFSFALIAVVVIGALATAGLASAVSGSVHVKVTKKVISISGSRGSARQVVQINYDPKKCGSYVTEVKRATEFSDLRGTTAGAFDYKIRRSGLHLSKPAHYVCAFLIILKGSSFHELASASAKLS
jgi:hypothetical protein